MGCTRFQLFQAMAEEPSEPEPSGSPEGAVAVEKPEEEESLQATGPAQSAPEAAAAPAAPAPDGRAASGSIAGTEEDLVEIVVPEDCAPGDKFVAVFEMELKVPEGCEGGDV